MTGNNPKLHRVNVDVHTKFGQILSINSQYIEWKLYSDVNQGLLLCQKVAKMTGDNKQDTLSMLMCIQNLVRFYQFVLEILSGNEILTLIKGRNSVKIL